MDVRVSEISRAVRRFGLKSGDKAVVLGPFDQQPERYVREGATADALSAAGLCVAALIGAATVRERLLS